MLGKPCAQPGCPALVPSGFCIEHARQRDKVRGTRQQRGYDATHDAERARWGRIIELQGWPCARCPERIQPGEDFHLDHTDDRTGYLGPSHVQCNLKAAGKASHKRGAKR